MKAPSAKTAGILIASAWVLITAANMALLPGRHLSRVKAEAIEPAPMDLMVRAPGILQPSQSATLKAEFEGPVARKLFKEGDQVRAGQILAEIGREKIQMEHMGKINEVKNAGAELRKATNELKLQKTLYRRKAVARAAVDDAKRSLEKAQQGLEIAKASFRMEMERWNRNILKAPINGTVTKDGIGMDQAVSAGKELVSIGDLSSYTMEVRVDQLDIGSIKVGQEALVRLQAYEDRPLKAAVSKIGTQSDDKGIVQFPVQLRISAPGDLPVLPQFAGEGKIFVGQTEPVISVPLSALATLNGKRVVWIIGAFDRIKAAAVEIGRSNPERAEVTRGLAAGARVCAQAQPDFQGGMRVKIQ